MATYTFTLRSGGGTLADAGVSYGGVTYDIDAALAAGSGTITTTDGALAETLRQVIRSDGLTLLLEGGVGAGGAALDRRGSVPLFVQGDQPITRPYLWEKTSAGVPTGVREYHDGASPQLVGTRIAHVGPAFTVLSAATANYATAKSNGCTHVTVSVDWETVQTSAGGPVDVAATRAAILAARAAGLHVTLELRLHYTPAFVQSGVPKFKDQLGNDWTATNVSGNNVRDWVWSAIGRQYVADFIDKTLSGLSDLLPQVDRMRLGGMQKGELHFPDSPSGTDVRWWGYSSAAQGTGIAAGMSPAPNPAAPATDPNTVPIPPVASLTAVNLTTAVAGLAANLFKPRPSATSGASTWNSYDANWVEWYNQSLCNWMKWLIAQHRRYFPGPIWVMHPGAGLRPTSQTPNNATPSAAQTYTRNMAEGRDWDRQIANYPDATTWPHSTWGDALPFWPPDPYSRIADGNAAPWYWLFVVALKYGRAGRITAENTGSNTDADMTRMFSNQGAMGFGFEGLTWLDHAALAAGTGGTYANWKALISAFV